MLHYRLWPFLPDNTQRPHLMNRFLVLTTPTIDHSPRGQFPNIKYYFEVLSCRNLCKTIYLAENSVTETATHHHRHLHTSNSNVNYRF